MQLSIFHSDFHTYPHPFHCNFSLSSSHYFILIFIPTPSDFIVIFHCTALNISFRFHTYPHCFHSNFSLCSSQYFILIFILTPTPFIVQLTLFHSDFHTYPFHFLCDFSLYSSQYFIPIFIPTFTLSF